MSFFLFTSSTIQESCCLVVVIAVVAADDEKFADFEQAQVDRQREVVGKSFQFPAAVAVDVVLAQGVVDSDVRDCGFSESLTVVVNVFIGF